MLKQSIYAYLYCRYVLYIHVDIQREDMCQLWGHMVCWYYDKFGCIYPQFVLRHTL
jgi:hypothetical protein